MGKRVECKKGQKIGSCYYIKKTRYNKHRAKMALFRCGYCDTVFECVVSDVRGGHTKSCGCLKRAKARARLITHGLNRHPLHYVWMQMKKRCYREGDISYPNYGGRGITVCDEWINDFKAFYDHVIALKNYRRVGYTLDRINNDGNYEPGNLRWATRHTQCVNQRKRKDNKLGYTGVTYFKRNGKFRAYIKVHRKRVHLGYFDTKELAVQARNNYIIENNLTEYRLQ